MKKHYLQFILIIILSGFVLFIPNKNINAEPKIAIPSPQIQISPELTAKLTAVPDCHDEGGKTVCENRWISSYIEAIYKYLIGIVGILATVVMMIGGVIWITAGGNASRVGEAKAWIGGALMGLVLALSSYTILYQINDETVKLKPITYTKIDKLITGCCKSKKTNQYLGTMTNDECGENDGDWGGQGTIWDGTKCNKQNTKCPNGYTYATNDEFVEAANTQCGRGNSETYNHGASSAYGYYCYKCKTNGSTGCCLSSRNISNTEWDDCNSTIQNDCPSPPDGSWVANKICVDHGGMTNDDYYCE